MMKPNVIGTLGLEGTRGGYTQEGIVVARRKDLCNRVGVKTAKLLQGREEGNEFSDLSFLHHLLLLSTIWKLCASQRELVEIT